MSVFPRLVHLTVPTYLAMLADAAAKSAVHRLVKGVPVYRPPLPAQNAVVPKNCNLIAHLRQEQRSVLDQDSSRWSLFRRRIGTVRPGSLLRIHYRLNHSSPSSHHSLASFTGVLLAIRRHLSTPTILVRSSIDGVGVEQIFCVFSPMVQRIEVMRRATKWKGSKLYWLRDQPQRIPGFYK